jgi:hypothetical protein
MKRFLFLSSSFLLIGAFLFSSAGRAATNSPVHDYQLDLQGTAGVRLHMLLITKSPDKSVNRREEIVTLPTKIDFNALSCYAWFDTLPKGTSGNEGDVANINLMQDGRKIAECDGIIKKQNDETLAVGDL